MTLLKINRLLPIHISIVLLKFEADIQSQSKVRVWKPNNPIWPPGGHFESDVAENQQASAYIGPLSTCIWNLKLKFQSKLDLCSGNHVVYRQTDGGTEGRTDKVNPVYPPLQLRWAGVWKLCDTYSIHDAFVYSYSKHANALYGIVLFINIGLTVRWIHIFWVKFINTINSWIHQETLQECKPLPYLVWEKETV